MGDFNVDLLANNAHVKPWLNLLENFQLHQLIDEPTRISSNSATLVDHVFTLSSAKVRAVNVPKIGPLSYMRCIQNFDQDKFLNDLNHCSWDSVEETKDIFTTTTLFE